MHIKWPLLFAILLEISVLGRTENMELLADSVKKEGNLTIVSGNVLMFSQSYLSSANKATYDEQNKQIKFIGDVNFMDKDGFVSRANFAEFFLENSFWNFETSFIINQKDEVWLLSDNACDDSVYYNTTRSVVSSCNVQNPDWSVHFSSGKLNKKTKYLHLFNPTFYIGRVPVMYLPYFGFPTDKTRRSGLLIPKMSYKQNDGFTYRQSLYIAPNDWWDIEFDAQIRQKRGYGLYPKFRFVDSAHSKGFIKAGIFKEKDTYAQKHELKNNEHKGIEFGYERDKLVKYLLSDEYKEGLWIDFKTLKDIEYLSLQHTGNGEESEDSLVASKLNYFISKNKNYFGLYMRYYLDLYELATHNNNKKTLQELPTLQYHRFKDTLFLNNILYSFDLFYHNYEREIGAKAQQIELNLPLILGLNLFEDYVKLKAQENFYATYVDYENNKIVKNGKIYDQSNNSQLNLHTEFALITEFAKAYANFFHTINFSIEHTLPGYNKNGIDKQIFAGKRDFNDALKFNQFLEENFISQINEKYINRSTFAKIVQYFYNQNGRKIAQDSIEQGYYHKSAKFTPLVHNIWIYPSANISINNKFEYNTKDEFFSHVQTSAAYSDDKFYFKTSHIYKNDEKEKKDSYLGLESRLNLSRSHEIFGAYQYDLQNDFRKSWEFGYAYKRKCWNFALKYKEDARPKFTKSGQSMEKESDVFLFITFYPIGEFLYDHSIHQYNKEQNDDNNTTGAI